MTRCAWRWWGRTLFSLMARRERNKELESNSKFLLMCRPCFYKHIYDICTYGSIMAFLFYPINSMYIHTIQ